MNRKLGYQKEHVRFVPQMGLSWEEELVMVTIEL